MARYRKYLFTVLCSRFTVFCLLFTVYCLPSFAQQEYEITIETTLGDTTETFWLQIPAMYQPTESCPLLIGWHQWGGNHLEIKYQTDFDSIGNAREWIVACHHGACGTHWNNQPTQSHVVDMIAWIEDYYAVDTERIYMVGSSMGGAAAMIFANNHLDPDRPMVAAAASMSGIQDCERRFYEQGINNSMIASFGGTPAEVPFEYHRNSAIYFDDYSESMHYNASHLPLYLTFGRAWTDSIWRRHAEDLYDVMVDISDTVVIYESGLAGHGWTGCEEELICDFFENFTANRYPQEIEINADQEGDWYWADITMRDPVGSFAMFSGTVNTASSQCEFTMTCNVASASLNLQSVGFTYPADAFYCQWNILDGEPAQLLFEDLPGEPFEIRKNNLIYHDWSYNPTDSTLTLDGESSGFYSVYLDYWAAPRYPIKLEAPPFTINGTTETGINYQLAASGIFSWKLYNALGRKVCSNTPALSHKGYDSIILPPGLSSGIYIIIYQLNESQGAYRVAFMK